MYALCAWETIKSLVGGTAVFETATGKALPGNL